MVCRSNGHLGICLCALVLAGFGLTGFILAVESDAPEVAFTDVAPLAGGPFVTVPTDGTTQVREPRARHAGESPRFGKFIEEP